MTDRQRAIFNVICQGIAANGFPPTIREIGGITGIKSPNGVMCHLKALEKKGYIQRDPSSARAIRILKV